ncbi:hypothetical protein ACMD2_23113 [Ananas comosus]|uniref:Uncharacterized protein n=1 Tax=Ananas comosus TaxID=4615 RepID=A0A199VXA9_ANACO|nr:hypothetical protein ACMD2_23113 [Ananas comosus]
MRRRRRVGGGGGGDGAELGGGGAVAERDNPAALREDAGEEAGGGRAEAGAVAAARRLLRLPGGGVRRLGWGGGGGRMACRHVWAPVGLLTLGHAAVYAAVAHHLRCINGFRYQRRCHKLTLALATDRLKHIKASSIAVIHYGAVILVFGRYSLPNFGAGGELPPVMAVEIEIPYQEPPESYLGKFKRSWAMHFGFLMCTFGFMVSSAVVILCF